MERLTQEQLDAIGQFDGPTVCNALECFAIRPRSDGFSSPGIQPRTNSPGRLIGYAATAKVSARHPPDSGAGERLMEYYAQVGETAKPTVAVIQDIDPQPIGSFWGEVQATVHKALGAIGTVTHGGVRDTDEADSLGFQFFATEVLISHAYIHVVEQGRGVEIKGLRICPGDLVFADKYGVVKIPPEIAPRLPEACRLVAEAELPLLEPCREAIAKGTIPGLDDLKSWREAINQARNAVAAQLRSK
ncbi:MAG: RraA family protein [Planctomycetota bacterium]|jgi:regulator of RNase E activity RraA|nr:RraA family protein [Planctomycetota bacterium]